MSVEERRSVAIHLPGNGGNVKALRPKLDELRQRGLYEVMRCICAREGALVEDLFGTSRSGPHVRARQMAWWELKDRGWTYQEIGRLFDRDRETIRFGVWRAAKALGMTTGMKARAAREVRDAVE